MPYNHTRKPDQAQRDLETLAAKLMHYFGLQRSGKATPEEEGMYQGLSDAFSSSTGVNVVALTMALDLVNSQGSPAHTGGMELLRQLSLTPERPERIDVASASTPHHTVVDKSVMAVSVVLYDMYGRAIVVNYPPDVAAWLLNKEVIEDTKQQ